MQALKPFEVERGEVSGIGRGGSKSLRAEVGIAFVALPFFSL